MIELDTRPHSRRIKILPISADSLIDLLKNHINATGPGEWLQVHGLPADATVVGVTIDSTHRELHLIRIGIESSTFEETPPGVVFPELRVEFSHHRKA